MIYHRQLKRTCFGGLALNRKPVALDGLVYQIDRDYTTSVLLPKRNSVSGLWYVTVDRCVNNMGKAQYEIWAYDYEPNVITDNVSSVCWKQQLGPDPVRLAYIDQVRFDNIHDFYNVYCFDSDVNRVRNNTTLSDVRW